MNEETPRGLRARLEEQGLQPGERPYEHPDFYVVSSDTIPGFDINHTIGLVWASLPLPAAVMEAATTNAVMKQIMETAEELGANAIIAFRLVMTTSVVMGYGTAVIGQGG